MRIKLLIASIIALPMALSSCDKDAVEVVRCVISDETLSIALKDPVRARSYLRDLGRRLDAGDPKAKEEAGDLIASLVVCLPEKDKT